MSSRTTSIQLDDRIEPILEEVLVIHGDRNLVVNTAILMFSRAEMPERMSFLQAFAALPPVAAKTRRRPVGIGGQVAAEIVDAVQRKSQRGKKSAG